MEYQSEPNRIFCTDAAGKCVAEITFPETTPGVCCIDHTFVDDSLRGMGIAGELVSRAVAQIRADGKQVPMRHTGWKSMKEGKGHVQEH